MENEEMRDMLALVAMQSILSNTNNSFSSEDEIAQQSYKIADAMLKARGE